MEKISVIVPVYNVEKYLNKCIDSIINQTYKNLEIILVDDGSKDNSGVICDDYAKNDSRIKVIHKENGGLADARNSGLDVATGEYIGFIDSDDFIDLDYYEVLYDNIINENADLSMCGLVDCYGIIEGSKGDGKKYIFNSEETVKILLEAKLTSVYAVAKLYKKEIFTSLRYKKGIIAEDAEIILDILLKCSKIVFLNEKKYYYIHRENSITTNCFKPERDYDTIKAYEKNMKLIEKYYPNLVEIGKMRLCWANFFVLDKMCLSNYEIDNDIVKYLKKRFCFIMKNNCFTVKRKISMILLMINTNLYKVVVKKFCSKSRKLYL